MVKLKQINHSNNDEIADKMKKKKTILSKQSEDDLQDRTVTNRSNLNQDVIF